jgi:hypothetical protein
MNIWTQLALYYLIIAVIVLLMRFTMKEKKQVKKCPGSEKCNLGYDCKHCKYNIEQKKK